MWGFSREIITQTGNISYAYSWMILIDLQLINRYIRITEHVILLKDVRLYQDKLFRLKDNNCTGSCDSFLCLNRLCCALRVDFRVATSRFSLITWFWSSSFSIDFMAPSMPVDTLSATLLAILKIFDLVFESSFCSCLISFCKYNKINYTSEKSNLPTLVRKQPAWPSW